MSSRYLLKAEAVAPSEFDRNTLHLTPDHKYSLEISAADQPDSESFAVKGEGEAFWAYIKTQITKILQPFRASKGQNNFLVFAAVYTVAALFFFVKRILKGPLERGWRLEVVRLVALKEENPVPGVNPDKILGYFGRGWILIIMRFIYFFPLFVIALFSGTKMLNLAKEIVFYIWDLFIGAEQLSFVGFMMQKVIPQAGIEIIIQLVVLALYGAFVWPIYRLIMVQYALKMTSASGFLSMKTIKNSIKIFKRNAALIYGIYGFSLAMDTVILITAKIISTLSFGLLFFILPAFHLILRHWVKGYAYGYLGHKLLASGELNTGGGQNDAVLDDIV